MNSPKDTCNRGYPTEPTAFIKRTRCLFFAALLFLVIAHPLPAPIQEVPQTTPTPVSGPTTTAVKTPAPLATNVESPSKRKTGRFAGTWSGVVPFKDPFANGGGNQQCDFIVNGEENSLTVRVSKPGSGSYHTATTPLLVIGNSATCKGGFLKHMSTTLTLTGDGSTANVVVRDSIWGTSSGTVKKIK